MKIAIGSDHAGFALKELLKKELIDNDIEIFDVGTSSETPVDYPDFAKAVADAVTGHASNRGIVICGSGVGASIAANKVKGARASVCHDTYSAHQGVEHDDMNILVLGARVIGSALAQEIALVFCRAQFSQEERHRRRLEKVLSMENW